MALLLKDGPLFFPNILLDENFQKKGIIWGKEPYGQIGLNWAVIDPRRHKMYVWEKNQSNFVKAAHSLGASVFTNGSFNLYVGGNKYWSTIKVYSNTFWDSLWNNISYSVIKQINSNYLINISNNLHKNAKKYWDGHRPDGNIYGDHEGISVVGKHQPWHHHFGRRKDRFFPDYVIGSGAPGSSKQPGGLSEVIGGLFRSVDNYLPKDPQKGGIGTGHWGLAPFGDSSTQTDSELKKAGILDALKRYHEKEEEFAESDEPGYIPPYEGAPTCTGLIITAFYWGNVSAIATKLAEVRVKDAVRVDGNSSILLGHHSTSVIEGGTGTMSLGKLNYNRWGYQFQTE